MLMGKYDKKEEECKVGKGGDTTVIKKRQTVKWMNSEDIAKAKELDMLMESCDNEGIK